VRAMPGRLVDAAPKLVDPFGGKLMPHFGLLTRSSATAGGAGTPLGHPHFTAEMGV
jgi:hypothetical protein